MAAPLVSRLSASCGSSSSLYLSCSGCWTNRVALMCLLPPGTARRRWCGCGAAALARPKCRRLLSPQRLKLPAISSHLGGGNSWMGTRSLMTSTAKEQKPDSSDSSSEEVAARKMVDIPLEILGMPKEGDSFSDRVLKWIGRRSGILSRKAILSRASVDLYSNLVDHIDYAEFFEVWRLPDSLQSWFLVVHVHVWLLMVRLKREGDEGMFVVSEIVGMFWKDVANRMSMLGVSQGREAYKSMRAFAQQFYGLTVAYEEGLVSDDKVLAAAVWRNFVYNKEEGTDPEVLAGVVDYIRRQVKHMDSLNTCDVMVRGKLILLPLKPGSNNCQKQQ